MPNDPWSLYLEVLQYRLEALPVITVPLAPPIEPLQEDAQCAIEELLEARTVPMHSVVLVIPAEFAVQLLKDYGTKPLWDFIIDRSDRCRQEVLSCN